MATTGFLVIVNADAGTAEREAVDAACGTLAEHGPVERRATEDPEELDAVVADLGGRVLVVAGGDGSIHVAVDRLHRAGQLGATELALIPLGTGNDLARALGLPLDPAAAAEVAATGVPRDLDLIEDDADGVAVNAVHGGIGADAAARAEPVKSRFGPLAYPVGAVAAGVTVDGWQAEVRVDDLPVRPAEGDALLMFAIGNGATIGGGTRLSPRARPDDGELDVLVCHAVGPVARLAFGAALARGEHTDRDDVAATRGREIELVAAPPGLPLNVDGELVGDVERRRWRVVPRAWSIRVGG